MEDKTDNHNLFYEEYFSRGREAFRLGIRCAPMCDSKYMWTYKSSWVGVCPGDERSKIASNAAKAWISGWITESLNANEE